MFGIIAIALSVLTILAGLFLLAKSKKESLGNLFVFSSYAAIIGGVCLLMGGLIGGSILLCRSHCGPAQACYSQSVGGAQCSKAMTCGKKSSCKMMGGHHGSMGKGACCAMGMGSHHGMGGCHMSGKMIKEILDEDGKKIEIEIEVEDDDEEEEESDS